MDRPLFIYGTLRDPELLAAVLGRPPEPGNVLTAIVPGFVAVHYGKRIFPALVREPGGSARGLLVLGLSAFDIAVIDAYEAEYTRGIVPVIVDEELHEADAYLPALPVGTDAPAWSLETWQQLHKTNVLLEDNAVAARIRQKLIAARPN